MDLAHYYLAPGGATTLHWMETRVPAGATVSGTGTGTGPGTPTVYSKTFTFPGSTVLQQPELEYSMLVTFKGQFELRVDAIVQWTPRKSRFSIVPPGATRAVVRVDRGPNAKTGRVTVVTVTRRSTIDAVIARINGLAVANPGVEYCPLDIGSSMRISFYRANASDPYAVVTAHPTGCGLVTISEFSAGGAALGVGHDSGGSVITKFVATTLGIKDWTGFATLTSKR